MIKLHIFRYFLKSGFEFRNSVAVPFHFDADTDPFRE